MTDATARTSASFGYEWTTFDKIQPEDEEFWQWYFRDVAPTAYEGKLVLDAGCGKGRFAYFTARRARGLVALDNSAAVHAAARNLGGHENAIVVKGDVVRLPFADETFEFISCLGVLHHLAEPEAAFGRIVRTLRPGGVLLLYMYSRPERRGMRSAALGAARWVRVLTVRLPFGLLRRLSAVMGTILYIAYVVPGRFGDRHGLRGLAGLPLATYRGKPLRSLWLDTFDRLSAPLETRYVWSELEPWFAGAGMTVDTVREEAGFFVVATKS